MSPNATIRKWLLIIACGTVFFLIYSFLPLSTPLKFNSPDEMSNHFFAELFAKEGMLYRIDTLNVLTEGLIHPRSIKVVSDAMLVPGGFLGLPVLYGAAAKAFGTKAIVFLTPLLSVLGALAWGLLLRKLFGGKVGLFAALLLLANPAWWYWSARTMMPNVPFLSLFFVALYLFVCAPIGSAIERGGIGGVHLLRRADPALAGIFFGLALAVRSVEAYWIAVAAVAAVVMLRGRLPWGRVVISLVFAAFTLAPFLMLNQSLYGNYIATGYGDVAATVADSANGGMGARMLGPLRPWLFPLGFAPRTALANFWEYGIKFFWWWSLIVIASGSYLLRERRLRPCLQEYSRRVGVFAAVGAALTLWLIAFYGSWTLQDNPDASAVTIGSSYLRYWLPIFALSTAPVAAALARYVERFRRRGMVAALAALTTLTFVSGYTVFASPDEGLTAVRANVIDYAADARTVNELTESNALIVVDRADKVLFPERSVMYPLRDERTYAALPVLSRHTPLYYFGITLPERDMEWLNAEKLPPLGLKMEVVKEVGEETLYRFAK